MTVTRLIKELISTCERLELDPDKVIVGVWDRNMEDDAPIVECFGTQQFIYLQTDR